MDDQLSLAVISNMAQCVARLAEVHPQLKDTEMQNMVHDAALICLSVMTFDDPQDGGADLFSFDGGKMQ